MPTSIFSDDTGRRSVRVRWVVRLASATLVIAVGAIVLSMFTHVSLPSLPGPLSGSTDTSVQKKKPIESPPSASATTPSPTSTTTSTARSTSSSTASSTPGKSTATTATPTTSTGKASDTPSAVPSHTPGTPPATPPGKSK